MGLGLRQLLPVAFAILVFSIPLILFWPIELRARRSL
jgi:hypothetical protein